MASRTRVLAAMTATAAMAIALLGACSSSDDDASGADGGTFTVDPSFDAAFDACSTFSGNGTACTIASTAMCGPCDCVCAQGPTGLRWACIVDGSNCGAPVTGGGGDGSTTNDGSSSGGGDAGGKDSSSGGGNDANGAADTSSPVDANDGATGADADDGATE